MTTINGSLAEALPALVDPPQPQHPVTNPCAGCPRWQRTADLVVTDCEIYWRSTRIVTTMGEYRVITTLLAVRGEFVPYRTIYDKLKNIPGFVAGCGDDGFHTNVRSMIKRIRKKFLAADPAFTCIENKQGFGYAWRDR